MDVTKQQIHRGVVKYLEHDVLNAVEGDAFVLWTTALLTAIIKRSERLVDTILDNPWVILLARNPDGTYNTDVLFDSLNEVAGKYGNLDLKSSPLKLPVVFSMEDFKHLRAYIEGGA